MTVTYAYMRYYAEYEEEADSVEDAIRRLAWGEEEGSLSSLRVTDGDRVIEGAELQELVDEAWAKIR